MASEFETQTYLKFAQKNKDKNSKAFCSILYSDELKINIFESDDIQHIQWCVMVRDVQRKMYGLSS